MGTSPRVPTNRPGLPGISHVLKLFRPVLGSASSKDSAGPLDFVDTFERLIDGLPEEIALVDEHWTILAVNVAWTKAAAAYDYDLAPGANYLQYCERRGAEGHSAAAVAAGGAAEVASGAKDAFCYIYHGRDRWEGSAFQLCINRVEIADRKFATIARYNVTELVKLRQLRENFSDVLIEGQAEERQRVARDVHDSTMQILVALDLSIGQVLRGQDPQSSKGILIEMRGLIEQAQLELRSIAFLAYPPPLREMGLIEALRALTDGYGRRTGLRLSLHIDASLGEEWHPLEVVIYRMVQEALSNIHRHSKANNVWVGLIRRRGMIHAVVSDDGIGMAATDSPGVGLRSMRARLAEHGGRLIVRHGTPGTVIIASLKIAPGLRGLGDLRSAASGAV